MQGRKGLFDVKPQEWLGRAAVTGSEGQEPANRPYLGREVCIPAAQPERTAGKDVGLDLREPVCIHVEEGNFLLWKPGPLALRPVPFSAQFSSRHELASSSTIHDRGYKHGGWGWGRDQGKALAFFRLRHVLQEATGLHNEERRKKA